MGNREVHLAHALEDFESVTAGEHDVQDGEIERLTAELIEAVLTGEG